MTVCATQGYLRLCVGTTTCELSVSRFPAVSEITAGLLFNQPIGDWDVSAVTSMSYVAMA